MTDVLTLDLEDSAQAHFEALRRRYFPAERNVISAHLTLFHTLPRASWIDSKIEEALTGVHGFSLGVTGVRSLGKGVAYTLRSPELLKLHARLAEEFAGDLTPQDKQRFQPHVVVQNKVTPEAARALLSKLDAEFAPFAVEATGLALWHYLGGPWELARRFPFERAAQPG